MGLFDKLKQKDELPEKDRKWNKMWDLWAEGQAASPYAQLMTYESEVNNGGHLQYFDNTENVCDLKTEVETAFAILPEPLKGNLKRAYEAFLVYEENDEDVENDPFSEFDDVFYENEQLLLDLLQAYANTMKL